MPKWVRNALWVLLFLLLLARWRDVVAWLGNLLGGIRMPFSDETFHFTDPVQRFAAFGILIVMVVALWKIFWMYRSNRRQ